MSKKRKNGDKLCFKSIIIVVYDIYMYCVYSNDQPKLKCGRKMHFKRKISDNFKNIEIKKKTLT